MFLAVGPKLQTVFHLICHVTETRGNLLQRAFPTQTITKYCFQLLRQRAGVLQTARRSELSIITFIYYLTFT